MYVYVYEQIILQHSWGLNSGIHEHYGKTGFGEPDFSRRLLTPNGRLWDLVLTGKESEAEREEVFKIEKVLKKWKVVKC